MLQSIVSRRHLLGAVLMTGPAGAGMLSGCASTGDGEPAGIAPEDLRSTETSIPAFFGAAPTMTLRDPLAAFLGAAQDGIMTYRYMHAVRMAGHSCPVVAGTFLMLLNGLERLYGSDIPVRGDIRVQFAGKRDDGIVGVYASVASLITGAAPETGFAGLSGRFSRRDLLTYEAQTDSLFIMRRQDTGAAVSLGLDVTQVPAAAEMAPLQAKALAGQATEQERRQFAEYWQDRVRRMLIDNPRNPALVMVQEVSA